MFCLVWFETELDDGSFEVRENRYNLLTCVESEKIDTDKVKISAINGYLRKGCLHHHDSIFIQLLIIKTTLEDTSRLVALFEFATKFNSELSTVSTHEFKRPAYANVNKEKKSEGDKIIKLIT